MIDMKRFGLLCSVCIILVFHSSVDGQYLKVSRKSNIRQQPSSQSAILETAQKDQYLTLLDNGSQVEGYYHILISSGAGWIYRTMVRRYEGIIPGEEASSWMINRSETALPDIAGYNPVIPDAYYQDAEGLEGDSLKAALHRIIRGHKKYGYDDLWNLLPITDTDPRAEGNVILLYTMRTQKSIYRDRGGKYDYTASGYLYSDSWNREHVWAKSRGFPEEKDTAFTDLHHLRPADRSVNTGRNNRNFDYADEPYYDNGVTPTKCKEGSETWVWEPPDEVKGDVARMIFYMAVRYEGHLEDGEMRGDLEVVDRTPTGDIKEPIIGKLSALLEWHLNDPVSNWERRRNDIIHTYQGNRNPFIDHPEWIEKIW